MLRKLLGSSEVGYILSSVYVFIYPIMLHECIIIVYLYMDEKRRKYLCVYKSTGDEVYFLYKFELLKYKTVKAPNGR